MSPGAPAGERRHLPLRAINHISRVCRDVAATAAFYSDLLGFIPVQRPHSLEEKFEGCWLWRYGLGLHLIEGEPVPRSSEIDPKSDHLSFQADSLEDVAAELERRGVPFVRQTVTEGGTQVGQLFFLDPDRAMIEVCDCDQLPLVPVEQLDLRRCHTCALEADRLHEEAGDASPRAAKAAAAAAAAQSRFAAAAAAADAPCCGAVCAHRPSSRQREVAGRCASVAEEAEAMCVDPHGALAEPAEAPCRRSMDSSCSDACAM